MATWSKIALFVVISGMIRTPAEDLKVSLEFFTDSHFTVGQVKVETESHGSPQKLAEKPAGQAFINHAWDPQTGCQEA